MIDKLPVLRPFLCAAVAGAVALGVGSPVMAQVLDKQKQLEAQTFWDNRDFDWYKDNIPFFECPDTELTTTYYYRWELVTKHLTYGSPSSGYSFTEFIDRPPWSGTYGAISCPAGHQLYEVRWLRDPVYARDYSRYWFQTPGAQPRNYGTWLSDAIWAAHMVQPNDAFIKGLLPGMKANYEGWEKRQFAAEDGLFWQNGHDDGMEFNINSRQTLDILRGADGYRPGFNAYMWADALAIARTARLAKDEATAKLYESKAASLKANVQKRLWDTKREFFFPMSYRDEKDKDGNVVKKGTLTYETGKYAGSQYGRELHVYIPWQFDMLDAGYEVAWKYLMDPQRFYAPFGPTTVERNDPQFFLANSCCWWSGQSWPFATAQTLKGMANLLQNHDQNYVSRADYRKLLHNFAISHRKDGKPYLAEALRPDTGSFEFHDAYNHSEHYFHSSFDDLIITGLVGLKPRADNVVEIDPLASEDWPYFALDDVLYHGQRLSIIWDKDGKRYGRGAGLSILVNGKKIASRKTLGKLRAALPTAPRQAASVQKAARINYAVNNDGDYYPRLAASFTDPSTSLSKANDGNYWYTKSPPNRWTTSGSPNKTDWLEVDLGQPRRIDSVKLAFLDDGKDVIAPQSYTLEDFDGTSWKAIPGQVRTPSQPVGHRFNTVRFAPREVSRLRVTFRHGANGFTGLSEIEAWGDSTRPYTPAPPPPGNLAFNASVEGFPKATASFQDIYGGVAKSAIDGRTSYTSSPVNRWTSYGSPNATDWLEVDFGAPKEFSRIELYIYDDRGGVQPPASYNVQLFVDGEWRDAANQVTTPALPAGSAQNSVRFEKATASKVRVVFTHNGQARSGLTEMEVWKK